ncbi:protein of unknown function [Candidatus Nitrospira inopinata]|uniref:Uncharacterized protein n=1 Tax=Candidatus Nitrospira inopinata TaxID=1715989 RepID=A0A0S4KQ60_9BACT|nr:protein of unknown function [Candidatus Nitrospira inopinata]
MLASFPHGDPGDIGSPSRYSHVRGD